MLVPMRLYLVRHAESAPGEPDALRTLTAKGKKQARELGERLAAESIKPAIVLTSPLLRARETGEELWPGPRVLPPSLMTGSSQAQPATPFARPSPAAGSTSLSSGTNQTAAGSRQSSQGGPNPVPHCRHGRHRSVTGTAVTVKGLHKAYGSFEALKGISFEIEAGEVFGLLGPNGAGKTTTVEILEGYRRRNGGEISVLGTDPDRAGTAWRERIGIVLQSTAMYPNLTVREHVALFAGYYSRPRDVDEVVELVGLADKRDTRVKTLSGGQSRRLDLALGLIGDPEILFLDEPTTGFDPAARRAAWELIRSLRQLGKTVLLTTHYLDEAEQLSDRVAVLREGRIVALGTPADLTGAKVSTEIRYRQNGQEVVLKTHEPTKVLNEMTGQALARGVELEDLQVRRPTLEEIYLELTGGTTE